MSREISRTECRISFRRFYRETTENELQDRKNEIKCTGRLLLTVTLSYDILIIGNDYIQCSAGFFQLFLR